MLPHHTTSLLISVKEVLLSNQPTCIVFPLQPTATLFIFPKLDTRTKTSQDSISLGGYKGIIEEITREDTHTALNLHP